MPTNPFPKNDISISQVITQQQQQSTSALNTVRSNNRNVQQLIHFYTTQNSSRGVIRFPASDVGKYYMTIEMADYSRTNLFNVNNNSAIWNAGNTIVLPMPAELKNSADVRYTEADIGTFGGAVLNNIGPGVAQTIKDQINVGSNLSLGQRANAFGTSAGNIIDGIKNNPGAAVDAAGNIIAGAATAGGQNIARAIGLGGVAQGLEALVGYVPNHFFTVLLVGPSYSEYEFIWRLFPKNKADSDAIKRIYYELMNAKAPAAAGGGLFWKFPKMFRLAFYPNSQYLFKFKPSVLENATFNFAPGGNPAFYGGTDNPPEAVDIRLRFKEIEYWLNSDYIDDTIPTDVRGPNRGV